MRLRFGGVCSNSGHVGTSEVISSASLPKGHGVTWAPKPFALRAIAGLERWRVLPQKCAYRGVWLAG